jgi:hypothetical protein
MPQRAQRGGAIRARTSSARISVAQSTMYGTKSWLLIPSVSAARRPGFSRRYNGPVGWLMIALLAGAVAAVIGAEWPRLTARYGNEARQRRERSKRKGQLKLLRTETEEFAASVERDLDRLPTIEESDRKS